jgi:CMP-N-acetylneuraminic acid synthetase
MKRTQFLEKLYRHDGVVLFYKSSAFLQEDSLYIRNILPYYTPKERAIDIDTAMDFKWAEFLLSNGKTNSRIEN